MLVAQRADHAVGCLVDQQAAYGKSIAITSVPYLECTQPYPLGISMYSPKEVNLLVDKHRQLIYRWRLVRTSPLLKGPTSNTVVGLTDPATVSMHFQQLAPKHVLDILQSQTLKPGTAIPAKQPIMSIMVSIIAALLSFPASEFVAESNGIPAVQATGLSLVVACMLVLVVHPLNKVLSGRKL